MWKFGFGILTFLIAFTGNSGFFGYVEAQVLTNDSFFVERSFDLFGREKIDAQLIREDSQLYFYVEDTWWNSRSAQEQNDLRIIFAELGSEFENHIYPILTSEFGTEPRPGIDADEKIIVLIHQMGSSAGGYFRSGDVYEKLVSPKSNEHEMIYLNSAHLKNPAIKSFLAHEFTHLITINQKELLRRTKENVWLNEARSEYAPTLLGYDDVYKDSNLEQRVQDFLSSPTVSLTDWGGESADYGIVNLFTQYVVDRYGVDILVDSLHSTQAGVSSIRESLQKNGIQKSFEDIFAEWTVTVLINDCNLGVEYCYQNAQLENLRVTPTLYILPTTQTIFSTYHTATPWNGNWHRLVGGNGDLTLGFEGASALSFQVPYVLCDKSDQCVVKSLSLDEEQKGTITISDFGASYSSLTIIPFMPSTVLQGNGEEPSFTWEATVQGASGSSIEDDNQDVVLREQLIARLAELQERVQQLQEQLIALRNGEQGSTLVSCTTFNNNLSFGMRNQEVQCLQEFLRGEGQEVYPEGLVTGNFLSLTQQAVVRFQERYATEILSPLGLQRGTGYVGQKTREKINQLISSLVRL